MASPDLIIKNGDTRDWTFSLSDTDNTALDLTNCRVQFVLRTHEWSDQDLFVRDTGGTNSDYISVTAPATGGILTITPRAADWTALSDASGVFVGDFRVSDQDNTDYIFTDDVLIRVDESMI